jgi:hypothetical protein
MTVSVELPPEVEAGLKALAVVQGVSLQDYLRHVLEGQLASSAKPLTPAQRASLWRQATVNLPCTAPLPDQAISRAAIYKTRG